MYEDWRKQGVSFRLHANSVYVGRGWRFHIWRLFYPLERLDLWRLGQKVLPIAYSGSPAGGAKPSGAPTLPFVGPVYHESLVRDGILYRFITAVSQGRTTTNELLTSTDVYLFEWDLAGPWDSMPRVARKARRVDATTGLSWPHHWLMDADHYLCWDEKQQVVEVREFQSETMPTRTTAKLTELGPVRCNLYGTITVSRSAKAFVGEKNGLFLFDAQTLKPIRELKPSAAMSAFFAERKDELNNKNSSTFLTDDNKLLIRIATTYHSGSVPDESIAIIYDIDKDTSRDVRINVGLRADVKDVEVVNGTLWFYVTTTNGTGKWTQLLRDEAGMTEIHLSPAQHPDMEVMTWDPTGTVMVDIPGFEANPQPLDQDSDIQMQSIPSGATTKGIIRYGDGVGKPAIFRVGKISFW